MNLIGFVLSLVISGAIFGALGRLAIPGPNPMTIGMTILVGIGGAFAGAVIGTMIGASGAIIILLEILGAAGIVYLMQRRGRGQPLTAGTHRVWNDSPHLRPTDSEEDHG